MRRQAGNSRSTAGFTSDVEYSRNSNPIGDTTDPTCQQPEMLRGLWCLSKQSYRADHRVGWGPPRLNQRDVSFHLIGLEGSKPISLYDFLCRSKEAPNRRIRTTAGGAKRKYAASRSSHKQICLPFRFIDLTFILRFQSRCRSCYFVTSMVHHGSRTISVCLLSGSRNCGI